MLISHSPNVLRVREPHTGLPKLVCRPSKACVQASACMIGMIICSLESSFVDGIGMYSSGGTLVAPGGQACTAAASTAVRQGGGSLRPTGLRHLKQTWAKPQASAWAASWRSICEVWLRRCGKEIAQPAACKEGRPLAKQQFVKSRAQISKRLSTQPVQHGFREESLLLPDLLG